MIHRNDEAIVENPLQEHGCLGPKVSLGCVGFGSADRLGCTRFSHQRLPF